MGTWREYDTTADTGIEVEGKSPEDVFVTAGHAFAALTTNPTTIKMTERHEIQISDVANDLLLVSFLNELLYLLETEDFVPVQFRKASHTDDFPSTEPKLFSVIALGGKWEQGVHESRTEIKAVTYHALKFEKVKRKVWNARVVFDI
jgi:SHS2 domain-containing protein